MKTVKFPGWRTMSASQRYNAKMFRMFEEAKELEKKHAPYHAYIADLKTISPNQPASWYHAQAERNVKL